MRIGFDARMITHPGIGRYISCLLPEMVKFAPKDKFVLFGDPERLVDIAASGNVSVRRWTAPVYSFREQLFGLFPAKGLDILHVPHFNIPLFFKGKMVVTIHDLIYLLFPGSVPSPLAKRYASFMIASCMKKAVGIIAVSENTRKDLERIYGKARSGKISVVHEASGRSFRLMEDKTKEADVKCRYRLSDRTILYVGSIKPHKNIETLIKAFRLLKDWGVPHQLVICGRWDKKEDRLRAEMSDGLIKYLGEVPAEDLVVLYNMADVLLHPSLYEGFGLTVLEAMRCGTPVVTTDTSSLPEVAGKAAFTVPPLNVEQMADTVYNVLVNEELRKGMVEEGFRQEAKFSWERAARETLDVYREVHGEKA